MSENKIIIKYKTKQIYCNCCDQKLPKVRMSQEKEFKVNLHDLINWIGQEREDFLEYKDDLFSIIEEFIYETVHFYATSSYNKVIVDKDEIIKLKNILLDSLSIKGEMI